jgi:adenosylcobinamide-GDP ribazoletransferase
LLLKFASLQALLQQGSLTLLIIPPLIGRTALIALLITTPYVRVDGIGSQLVREIRKAPNLMVIGGVTGLIIVWLGWSGIALLLLSSSVTLYLRSLMMKRIDGATGDCAGALVEIVEAFSLLSLVMIGTS